MPIELCIRIYKIYYFFLTEFYSRRNFEVVECVVKINLISEKNLNSNQLFTRFLTLLRISQILTVIDRLECFHCLGCMKVKQVRSVDEVDDLRTCLSLSITLITAGKREPTSSTRTPPDEGTEPRVTRCYVTHPSRNPTCRNSPVPFLGRTSRIS